MSEHTSETDDLVNLCRDDDCPKCGYPETYSTVDMTGGWPTLLAIGCRSCGWHAAT